MSKRSGPSAAANALSELQKGAIIDMLLDAMDEIRELKAKLEQKESTDE